MAFTSRSSRSALGTWQTLRDYTPSRRCFLRSSDPYPLKVSTQLPRAMAELGITHVFARSSRAKGRVERAAGTFQGRLVTELRHAGASTIPEAQVVLERFLPRFNARFRVLAAEADVAYRPLDPELPLASILSFRHARTVARDNTVKYRWRTLQLMPGSGRTSFAGTRVEVAERPDGELSVQHQGRSARWKAIQQAQLMGAEPADRAIWEDGSGPASRRALDPMERLTPVH